MPSANHTEVGIWRAVLLWAIVTGRRIDLPRILADSIHEFAHEASRKASLGHSSLIQYICEEAGVSIPPPAERKVPCHPQIDVGWICKTLGIRPDEAIPLQMPEGRRPQPRRAPQTTDTRLTSLEAQVRSIRHQNQYEYGQLHQYMDYMSTQMAYLCRDQPDGPPRFVPAPYDPTTADAFFAAPESSAVEEEDNEAEDNDEEEEEDEEGDDEEEEGDDEEEEDEDMDD